MWPSSSTPQTTIAIRRFIVQYGVYVSLGIVLVAAVFLTPGLYSPQTLSIIFRQGAQLGVVAIGQTLVLLVAGLDLSITGVIFVTSVVIARVSNGNNEMLIPAFIVAYGLGMLVGLANGFLVTKRKVPPFVATLGILILVQGALQAYTLGVPGGFVPAGLGVVNQSFGFITLPLVLWIVLSIVFIGVLRLTPFGRRIYAVGSNPIAARLSGLSVDRLVTSAYVLCSFCAVTSGIILTGYVGYVDRFIASGFDLDSIAAAVIGGTSFAGGRGSLLGTMAGVLLIQVLSTMALLLGLNIQVQLVIKGLVILMAVALYSAARIE